MNDFWFKWSNSSDHSTFWSFLDGGNYFELPPLSHRVEQNQYDLGDRIRIALSPDRQATLVLTGQGWKLEHGHHHFLLTHGDGKTVHLQYGVPKS
jgi:hypothetical protein